MSILRQALSVLHKLLPVLLFIGLLVPAHAASQPDPCNSLSFKQSAAISVATSTTTSLVTAVSGHSIFVCGFTMTIAGSATSAASAELEFGTGAACVTTQTAITGTMGSGDAAVSTTPTQVTYGDGNSTLASSATGAVLCIVTAGTASNVQGMVTYVQGTGSSYP